MPAQAFQGKFPQLCYLDIRLSVRLRQSVDLCRCDTPFFDLAIAPRYSHLVKHVRIVNALATTSESARFIGHLQRLPNLECMSLNAGAVVSWFVPQSDPPRIKANETVQLCWAKFAESLGKLNELVIDWIDSAHPALALLQSCCKLKSLTLEGMFRDSIWATSIQAVTHLPHLKHLKIAAVSGSSRELDLSSVLDKLKSAPAVPEISSLSIVAADMHESWLLLANLFSATLTELAFESSYDDLDSSHLQAPSFCFSTEHFPRLQALSICGPFSVSGLLVLSTAHAVFPSLRKLAIGLNFSRCKTNTSGWHACLEHAKKLVPLSEGGKIRLYDQFWACSSDQLEEQDVDWRPSRPFLPESLAEDPFAFAGGGCLSREDLPEGVAKVIDHVLALQSRATRSDTDVEWMQLEKLLRDAALHMVHEQC